MEEQTIIQTGSFGSGITRRIMDTAITWPTPFSYAGKRYWKNLFRDDENLAIKRLGHLESKGLAWATTLAWELIGDK